jgi:hypothetical protein
MFSVFTTLLAPVAAPSLPAAPAPEPTPVSASAFTPAEDEFDEIPSDWESKGCKGGVCVIA